MQPSDVFLISFAAPLSVFFLIRRLRELQRQPRQPRRGGKQNGAFGWTAAVWSAVAAGVGATAAVASVVEAQDASRRQGHMAADAAKINAQNTDEANNRANMKAPDSAAMMAANVLAGKAGSGSTMLTGPQGVDQSQLTLGKTTLLGG